MTSSWFPSVFSFCGIGGRAGVGLVLAGLAVVLFVSPAAGQGTYDVPALPTSLAHTSNFKACMQRYALPADLDPEREQGVGSFQTPFLLIENALFCAEAFAGEVMKGFARPFYVGLMIIVVVWTGIQMMFSGRVDMAEVVSLVLLIGFVVMLWGSYPVPGGGPPSVTTFWGPRAFPIWVGSLGRSVADPLVAATWDEVVVAFYEGQVIWKAESVTAESLAEACTLSRGRGIAQLSTAMVESQACAAYRGARNASGSIQLVFVFYMLLGLIFGAIPLLVAYFSYLWGFFSLIIVTIMGPLLIPFALIPQTSFLFWGWIRAIISSTVQMMVGGAVFVLTGTLLLVPVERFTKSLGALIGTSNSMTAGDALGRGMSSFMEFLPLALIAMLGAFKSGELTSMILSGGGVPSSGIGERFQGARSAAKGVGSVGRGIGAAAGVAAGVATGGAALAAGAARGVLSAATKATKG